MPGEVLVRFDPGTGARARDRIRDIADVRLEERLPLPRAELLHTRPGQSVQEAISELESRPDVAYAEPNYIHRILATPNDTRYPDLWGFNNTAQAVNGEFAVADSDIDASEAWDSFTGDPNVIVAVLDTGLALDRPDIAPNVWVNPGETPNGVDDGDPLSFIDDVNGWDFAYDDKDPRDGNNHGTHVAGTVGAVGNNDTGVTTDVVGVNWNVTIMPVQVCTHVGSCPVSDQIAGIDYARDMGADVVNMSIGGSGFSQAQEDAINNASGTFFAVAAGNDGTNNDNPLTPSYPCSHDSPLNMVCVAASTQSDGLASFSNFGANTVDLAAPGTNVLSTVPTYTQIFFDNFEGANNWDWDTAPASSRWERTIEAPSEPSATQSVTDSAAANYDNGADTTMTLAATSPINLMGRVGCTLQYRLRLRTQSGDFLTVYASTNQAGPYTVIDQQTGDLGISSFIFADGDLEAFENDPSVFLQFRFTSNGSGTDEGAHVDNVEVRCAGVPDAGTTYVLFNGTSMATPHVAGAAALLLDADPTATVAELRSALLNSVESKPAFAGTTVTGGRLNVHQAIAVLTDPTPPDDFSLSAPPDGSTVTTRTPLLSWNASSDNMGLAEYELYVDGNLARDNIHPGATSHSPATPLSEGPHTWFVKARDFAGNEKSSAETFDITVDVDETPPSFPTLVSPANGTTVNTQAPTFTWNPATDSESGVSKHQLVIDGAVSRDGLGAAATTTTPGAPLGEGPHTWLIRAFDGAGNSADSVQRSFTVDLAGSHARDITLTLKKHLKAKGKVTVADGFTACIENVAVVLERKGKGGWKNLKTIATGAVGAFATTLPDRVGKYRSRVPTASAGPVDMCSAATSPGQRHRHA